MVAGIIRWLIGAGIVVVGIFAVFCFFMLPWIVALVVIRELVAAVKRRQGFKIVRPSFLDGLVAGSPVPIPNAIANFLFFLPGVPCMILLTTRLYDSLGIMDAWGSDEDFSNWGNIWLFSFLALLWMTFNLWITTKAVPEKTSAGKEGESSASFSGFSSSESPAERMRYLARSRATARKGKTKSSRIANAKTKIGYIAYSPSAEASIAYSTEGLEEAARKVLRACRHLYSLDHSMN